jgi:cell division septum initiation protein DivIVA
VSSRSSRGGLASAAHLWIDWGVDLEDALTAAQQRNEQQEKLIAFLQQNIEAFQATQHELIEQIRALNRILEQEKEASTARVAEMEAMIRRLTAKLDALLVYLGEQDPPKKPDKDDEEASKTTSSSDDTEKPKGTSG